ncbi:LPS export ABC transporter periplasmic protein LptC [Commensalibacter oyaizuii]|uniref:LPS export ABC transporter periplasmic protein LptC n=1 Tax=Commensalibacter oyaizuii TaxID=3043873 RepID=A0ABT6PZ22_9PROT|nr:LPS export ABC transporter periplasmic protein LptC [Commensalibacter sp. TBRC 16381]MDI2090103.1 LPS export ABC transporter periplasmic protein LptC [Commensalibacter sp. TBRC 16381]
MNDNKKEPSLKPLNSSSKVERTDFQNKQNYLKQRARPSVARRQVPKPEEIHRRKQVIKWTKWILPALALLLLGSIAVWPEIDRIINTNKEIIKQLARIKVESGTMVGATFHGLDSHDRPYTITSNKVVQKSNNSDMIRLSDPKADILLQNNDWLMVTADQGIYMQHQQNLNLYDHVVLYRDDGLFMYSDIADIALKYSVVTADNWIHAEGPFGQLDAQAYFLDLHAGIAQFQGPGRLILNDDKKSSSSSPSQPLKSSE